MLKLCPMKMLSRDVILRSVFVVCYYHYEYDLRSDAELVSPLILAV